MLIALALLAPGHARAGQVDDACRQASGPALSCVGMEKLGERLSAECRRAGAVSDEQCAAIPAGRRVIRSAVDDYQRTWTHRALTAQYALGDDVPFANAPWIGTHNSFNSTSEFPTASHTDSNQQLSLTDQLRVDMRKLEIDVHWFPSLSAGGAKVPVVCHGRGGDQLHAGCTTERTLAQTLPEVAGWLHANPGQVLLLYIEDNLDGTEGQEATAQVLRDSFGSLLYRPPASGSGGCASLPLSLTRRAVLAAGAQVVVVSGCGGGAGWRSTVFDWDASPAPGTPPVHVETSAHGYGADCAPGDFPRSTYETRLVRYYEDATFVSAAVDPSSPGYYDTGVTKAAAANMVRCGVDLIDFDEVLPGDERLDAVVWSWAPGEPAAGAGDCAAQGADGRWRARPCRARLRAACRRPDGTWTVTARAMSPAGAARACRRARARFAVPRTGSENVGLRAARPGGTGDVWLAYARRSSRRAWTSGS